MALVEFVVPVACYSAREIAWRRWEQSVVVLCGVAPIAAVSPVFQAGIYWRNRGATTALATFGGGCDTGVLEYLFFS